MTVSKNKPQQGSTQSKARLLTFLAVITTAVAAVVVGLTLYLQWVDRGQLEASSSLELSLAVVREEASAAQRGREVAAGRLERALNDAGQRAAELEQGDPLADFGAPQQLRSARQQVAAELTALEAAGQGLLSELEVAGQMEEPGSALVEAAGRLYDTSRSIQEPAGELSGLLRQVSDGRWLHPVVAAGVGGLALLFLMAAALFSTRVFREVLEARAQDKRRVDEESRRNQEAILKLLDEIEDLREGDLRTQASVGEEITGAIADAFNDAIDNLRSLVATINRTAEQVSSSAQQTQATAMHLAEASDHQAQQITSASGAIEDMATSIDQVSRNAEESARVAQQAVDIATKGAETVRATIEGMDTIREQIQETAKRIKRLGESSQEIGNIVELINDISDQTNILALNASIQAAMAGETGRGFAVVADEVQRLAERSGNATKQIEALVKTIQTDTNEAVLSMEQSTAGVVEGAQLAENAGDALREIESVSNDLASLIQSISGASRQQADAAANVSDTMKVIQEITHQTSAGTNETANSIGNLTGLARDLRSSVAGFKLPEND
ncbi:methyl-accepting chemotaxis protein [Alkalispirillum mobile]|uniref:Methyl-accepting chemotaxis protein n=1 Tax=Alkalispirillum mobile TaxID=85925 RepID=A0A498C8H1_9GAMM|nr:methyl-accepting chemotaxis protein [Alkalispirillum mobile]RLK51389.1 methyl-accepting chemotaxis protein [Alkalispirillum mobile]